MKLTLTKKEARKLAGIATALGETDTFSTINLSILHAAAKVADKNGTVVLEFPDELILKLYQTCAEAMEDECNLNIADILVSTFGDGPIMQAAADLIDICDGSEFADTLKELLSKKSNNTLDHDEDDIDMEDTQRHKKNMARLKAIVGDPKNLPYLDQVAFDQEELADLLDDGVTTIYLCGGSDEIFQLPARLHNVQYVGIGIPKAHINGKITETREELAYRIIGCRVDNMPDPDGEDVKDEVPAVEHNGYSGKGPKPEDLMEYGGIEALPLSGWECDCPAYGTAALYGFGFSFIGMVDKDKRIKSIDQVWFSSLPDMTIEDLTDEELAFIKTPSMYTMILRTATMAIAEENATDYYKKYYEINVRRGMLEFPESFNYPLKWRAVRKTGQKIWDR